MHNFKKAINQHIEECNFSQKKKKLMKVFFFFFEKRDVKVKEIY